MNLPATISRPAPEPRPALRAVALISALLVWVLGLLSASPQLHAAIHDDAAQVDHACAVTLFSQGTEEISCGAALVAAPILFPAGECAAPAFVEVAAAAYRFPPGCGPPRR